MEKDTYDFTVKQRSRKLIFKFIKRNFKKFHNLKVLCFPGEECIEIFEIWDKLGVKRENIVCLERNGDIAKRIQEKDLGVEVIPHSLKWFSKKDRGYRFDILSLDFQGTIGIYINDTIKCIEIMTNPDFILMTNFLINY